MERSRLLPLLGALAAVVVLIVAVWPSWRGTDAGGAAREVRVGLYENEPKVHTGANGRPAGLFVELLNQMARDERWQLRYVPCAWSRCLEMLQQGQIDLMPDVAFSVDRTQDYDFHTASVASSWSQIYVAPHSKVFSLADLADKRVAMLQGGIQQAFFAQLMAGAGYPYQPVPVTSLEQAYAAVVAGGPTRW